MKKKKIFFVHFFNDYSGSPLMLKNMINTLDTSLIECEIFTSKTDGFLSNIENCNYTYIHYKYANNKLAKLLFFFLAQVELFIKLTFNLLCSMMKGKECIVINNTVLPFSAGLSSFFFAKRVIYYIHETSISPAILMKVLLFGAKHFSDEIIYVSKYTKNTLCDNRDSSVVILNSLRQDFKIQEKINFPLKHEQKKALFVGSLKNYKGIYNLIRIIKLCPDVEFIVALNCTEYDFEKFKNEHKKINNAVFYHKPDFIEELYNDAFLILNLSIPEYCTETFGLSILEGISYGCVPIVPPAGGPLEIVDPDFGYYIHSNHVEEISKVINELSLNYNLWFEKSQLALTKASTFSFHEYKKSINKFLGI